MLEQLQAEYGSFSGVLAAWSKRQPDRPALRDEHGNYRITGRVDDVIIVSGHNLGTAPIENAINEHDNVVESAIVGFPHDVKGNALYAYVILYDGVSPSEALEKEINEEIATKIGPIAKCDKIGLYKKNHGGV